MPSDLPPIETIAAIIIVIFFAIGLHEYAHCKVADAAGDPTPSFYGRVTLNLFKHFEPLGTLMIFITALTGFGIGWGRPAPMNPSKMNNPRWDYFAAVAAGPISNILQAVFWALLWRAGAAFAPDLVNGLFVGSLLLYGVLLNLSLCFFNLIPLGRLDGHHLVGILMPEKQRYYWFRFNQTYGSFILIGVVLLSQAMSQSGGTGLLSMLVGPPIRYCFRFLTGFDV